MQEKEDEAVDVSSVTLMTRVTRLKEMKVVSMPFIMLFVTLTFASNVIASVLHFAWYFFDWLAYWFLIILVFLRKKLRPRTEGKEQADEEEKMRI